MGVIKVPEIDFEKTISEIVDFIRGEVEKAGAAGVVLGLSGGIDSSLTAALCVRALGGDKVLGVIMPTSFTPKEDLEDALEVSRKLNMKTILVNIDDICETIVKALKVNPDDPRVRMP
ncbi:MAG: NAD(+) synthase, partial [Candidatus Bathyarchaeia archaeon]